MSAVPRIAVIGTVGVPARYGGFETLAEQLAVGITPERAQLLLYCQRSAYPEVSGSPEFAGHRRVFLPLKANGPGSMIHDFLALLHAALVGRANVFLVLGYSGAWALPLIRLLRPGARIVSNIDGMEWRREKFGPMARRVLRLLESFATCFSHVVIADNAALMVLARQLHGIDTVLIAYGGDHTLVPPGSSALEPGYVLSIARIEPENNSHVILAACARSAVRLVFVGNWTASTYGRQLQQRYRGSPNLTLLDPVYDQSTLAAIRSGAVAYLHGHSVGGSNPSLIEAVFHSSRILAYDCSFNRATLEESGAYFATEDALVQLLAQSESGRIAKEPLGALRQRYRWKDIVDAYLRVCVGAAGDRHNV